MKRQAQIEALARQLFEALRSADLSEVSLAEDAEFFGAMMPKAIQGADQIRTHLAEIAPFLRDIRVLEQVAGGDAIAVRAHFQAVNGRDFEGAVFLKCRGEALHELRFLFDTRPLFR